MALELAPHHILVNELAAGFVDAGLSGRRFEKDAAMREEAIQKVPVKKLITATEVAQQVLLLSDGMMGALYASALDIAGLAVKRIEADELVRDGLFMAARHAFAGVLQ